MTEETALNHTQQMEPAEPSQRQQLLIVATILLLCKDFLRDESGQDMIEYVLAAALISLVAISSLKGLSTKISDAYSSLSSNLTSNT
jgi:Flp pilus assembly pilin Flp